MVKGKKGKNVADGFALRVYPKKKQKSTLRKWIGCQRFVRNAKVSEDRYYRMFQRKFLPMDCFPPVDQQYARFVSDETSFLREVPSQVLRNGAVVFAQSYQRFFKGLARRPTIKKGHGRQSVWLTSELFEIGRDKSGKLRLRVGTKKHQVGEIEIVEHRHVPEMPKSIRLIVEGDLWHCSFGLEAEYPHTPSEAEMIEWYSGMLEGELSLVTVGVDRGIAIPFADSMGNAFDFTPEQKRAMEKAEKARKKHQRRAARRQNGSVGKRKEMEAAARKGAKKTRISKDFAHKTSCTMASDYRTQVFIMEKLNIGNMTKSASRTVENPGKNVAQKSGLNRAILGSAWGMTKSFLTYKAARRGKLVLEIDPRNTSLECPICGHIHHGNRPEQSLFVCQACGFMQNADTNAASVIKRRGVKALLSMLVKPKECKKCGIKKRKGVGTEDPESTPGESLSDPFGPVPDGQGSTSRETSA